MPSPKVLACGVGGRHCLVSLFLAVALALGLSACSTQPQTGPAETASAPPQVPLSEQCSILGVMACTAVSMFSGDAAGARRPTCIAFKAAGGARVERCGSAEARAPTTGAESQETNDGSVRLAWSDNSNDENNFVIERCDQINFAGEGEKKTATCAGSWRPIAIVGADSTSYVDKTAALNQTYIYRVKATNNAGSSDYTGEVLITTPSR